VSPLSIVVIPLCVISPLLGSYSPTKILLLCGASGCATTMALLSTQAVADMMQR